MSGVEFEVLSNLSEKGKVSSNHSPSLFVSTFWSVLWITRGMSTPYWPFVYTLVLKYIPSKVSLAGLMNLPNFLQRSSVSFGWHLEIIMFAMSSQVLCFISSVNSKGV